MRLELKVIEGNKKLKCVAISAKRLKTAVSTHLNVPDDPMDIILSAYVQ